jgi:hypothetical protein
MAITVFERGTVFETTQTGLEITPGTAVPTTKRILAFSLEPKPMVPIVPFRNMGSKFNTEVFEKKEWTQADMRGQADYQTPPFIFNTILQHVTPTIPGGGTNVRLWTYTPNTYSPDSTDTFTIEVGSAAGAERWSFGYCDAFAIRYTKDDVGLTGTWYGQKLSEQITMSSGPTQNEVYNVDVGTSSGGTFTLTVGDDTATFNWNDSAGTLQSGLRLLDDIGSPNVTVTGTGAPGTPWVITFVSALAGMHVVLTGSGANLTGGNHTLTITEFQAGFSLLNVEPILIDPTQIECLVSTDGISYTPLNRVFEMEFAINARFSHVMTLNDADPSYSAIVEKNIDVAAMIILEHNSVGAGFMTDLRAKTEKWFRFLATGPALAAPDGAFNYKLQIDFPFKFIENSRADHADVWSSTYRMVPIFNPTWQGGAALQVLVQNTTASLT